jgi:tripartite-type tricarboxylate transporter receptor subunit TctC
MYRRTYLALALLLAAAPAIGQSYPSRPIEIVVPYGPAGSTDAVARAVGQKLQERLGQSVIVLNRPGASGTLGITQAARAAPDGYTLLMSYTSETVVLPQVMKGIRYSLDDFEPIAVTGLVPLVLITSKRMQAKTLKELFAEFQAAPGKYTFGGGHGSPPHIVGAWVNRLRNLQLTHIPYRGGAQAVGDVAGGHVDMFIGGVAACKGAIDAGVVKAFAVTGDVRSSALPDIPTFAEAGVPELDLASWTAFFAPRGVPAEIVGRLTRETAVVLEDAQLRAALAAQGVEPGSTKDVRAFLASQQEKFGRAARELRITVE